MARSAPTKPVRSLPICARIRTRSARRSRASTLCAGSSMRPRRLSRRQAATRRRGSPCPPISTVSSRSSRCSAPATPAAGRGRATDGRASRKHRRQPRPGGDRKPKSRQSKPCSTKPKRRWRPTKPAMLRVSRRVHDPAARGLEALLIVVAMLAFLNKADRPELTRPVHFGWTSALAAGVATWWVATSLISVSGASRELTEGFGSLLAAAVLLFVGIWMHGKAQAGQWQRYIREKLDNALVEGSRWFLFSSPSSPSIARSSRRSCSSPRWPRRARRQPRRRRTGRALRWPRSRSRCCATAGSCRSANSSPTARHWSRCSPLSWPARASPRSRRPASSPMHPLAALPQHLHARHLPDLAGHRRAGRDIARVAPRFRAGIAGHRGDWRRLRLASPPAAALSHLNWKRRATWRA